MTHTTRRSKLLTCLCLQSLTASRTWHCLTGAVKADQGCRHRTCGARRSGREQCQYLCTSSRHCVSTILAIVSGITVGGETQQVMILHPRHEVASSLFVSECTYSRTVPATLSFNQGVLASIPAAAAAASEELLQRLVPNHGNCQLGNLKLDTLSNRMLCSCFKRPRVSAPQSHLWTHTRCACSKGCPPAAVLCQQDRS